MTSKHLEEDLYEFVIKRMGKWKYRRYEKHLKGCEICRKEAADISKTLEMLKSFQSSPPSEAFQESVLQKIREMPLPSLPSLPDTFLERLKAFYQGFFNSWVVLKGGAIAVAATLLIVLVYPLIFKHGELQPPAGSGKSVKIEKSLNISMSPVKHPIIVETRALNESLNKIKKSVSILKGELLDTQEIVEGEKITISIKKENETAFFEELNKLGKVTKVVEGYKDVGGNIIILLKKIK